VDRRDKKKELELARAFVPFQPFCEVFPLDVALRKGTIWTCLAAKPYLEDTDKREEDGYEG
jgi:hypothetical protein